MDFTREPIIESVITPKEGCKLVIRSSKGAGQEEFFVDSVEVVAFGSTFFLRSLEKPKAFLVPATDYEILEVRETRMVLKNVGLDRSIKIGGGKKSPPKEVKEPEVEEETQVSDSKLEPKRRERRRQYRRKRGRDDAPQKKGSANDSMTEDERIDLPRPERITEAEQKGIGKPIGMQPGTLTSLLPPPPTLISETIERYRGNEMFKNVFIPKNEEKVVKEAVEVEEELASPFDEEPEAVSEDLAESEQDLGPFDFEDQNERV